ncbi:Retrotransposon gag protein [Gossypium australe]|uniref:Retrotransposon gag protein n=1 Tax=Gossypium australe TaxID=47621 RepID=A0A5B6VL05_9ROSI|nr:Retrotransposon gag protein [Gossypium australe]
MVRIGNDPDREDPLRLNGRDVDIPRVIDDKDRSIRKHVVPILDYLNPGIFRPQIQALHFKLEPVMFQMLQTVGKFSGLPTEDLRLHLGLFLEVCDSFRKQDRTRAWLNALPLGTVASWNDLCQRFLLQFNPFNMNAKLRNDITSFWQSEDETLYKAWERFKELLRKCPIQGFQHWTQKEMFYNGLNAHTRMVVDAYANGTLLDKSYHEAYEIQERIANNDYQYLTTRVGTGRRATGTMELDQTTSLTTKVSSLANMIKTLKRPAAVQEMKAAELTCVYCREDHVFY